MPIENSYWYNERWTDGIHIIIMQEIKLFVEGSIVTILVDDQFVSEVLKLDSVSNSGYQTEKK